MSELVKKFTNIMTGDERSPLYALLVYSASLSNPKIKFFCFVEGRDDVMFYENVLPLKPELRRRHIRKKYLKIIDNGNNGGKKAVISTLSQFCNINKKTLQKKYHKAAFIIDNDYDGILSEGRLDARIKSNLTVLPCYSIENYFFEPLSNLKIVFRHFFGENCWENQFKEFVEELRTYVETLSGFWAWKKVCQLNNNTTKSFIWRKKDLTKNLFRNIDFTKPFVLPNEFKNFMLNAIGELRNYPILYNLWLNEKEKISKDLCIPRGKDLLYFLKIYLRQQHISNNCKELEERLFSISGQLKVRIDLHEIDI